MKCILCHSSNLAIKEKIKITDLVNLYTKSFPGYDFKKEFGEHEYVFCYSCSDCEMIFFHPQTPGSDLFYEYLQKIPWYYMEEKIDFSFTRKYIQPQHEVLEVGAGSGFFAKSITCAHYDGLEFNEMAIVDAEKKGIKLTKAFIEDYSKTKQNRYDVTCAFQVLEHVTDPHHFIKGCVDATKQGGHIIYSIPSADSYYSVNPNERLNLPPHHMTWWKDNTLKNIADLFNLKVVEIFHEQGEGDQRKYFLLATFIKYFNKLSGIKLGIIETSKVQKVRSYIAMIFAKAIHKIIVNESFFAIRGGTVIVVYEKK